MKAILTFLFLAPLMMATPTLAQAIPSGSFLTRFCAENPQDEFCTQIAKTKKSKANTKSNKAPAQVSGRYQMIRSGRVRSSPNTNSNANIIGTLKAGQKFTILRRLNNDGRDWLELKLADGRTAYIAASLAQNF